MGHAEVLDLDAEVVGHLDELTGWARGHATRTPHRVVDVGAGSGTGTRALARCFPRARMVAVDESATMLDHLRAAADRDLLVRLDVVEADLDAAWPDLGRFDLAWASSSLHHLREPDRVLADLHGALEPGGLLVVVEMDGLPRFLPEDVGLGRPGLEDRCRTAMAAAGWNAHPDWGPHLRAAGFDLVEERTWAHRRSPAPPGATRYARRVFTAVRSGLAGLLDAEDLEAVDHLLADGAPGSLAGRRDLVVRSGRTAWAARRA